MPIPTASDVLGSDTSAVPANSAPDEQTPAIPDPVLELPIMKGLLHGAPAAVYAPVNAQDPEIRTVVEHSKPLIESGFGFYRTKDGKFTVLYNGAYVSHDDLEKADSAGTIEKIASPFSQVKATFDAAVSGESVLPGSPAGDAGPADVQEPAPAQPATSPQSSRAQNTIATARVKNLQPGSPTSGPVPGRGRILNNILKPTI